MSGAEIEELINKAQRNAVIVGEELTKRHILEEVFVKYKISGSNPENKYEQARFLKSKNKEKKVFTLEVIGEIVGLSKGYLSNILKEDVDEQKFTYQDNSTT
jgi:hypothetical protein